LMRWLRVATLVLLGAAIVVPSRPAAEDLGTTQLLSATPSGEPVDGGAIGGSLSISSDGTVVAFPSDSNDIVPGDTSDEEDIVVLDLATGARELATVSSSGVQANCGRYGAVLSGDGLFVVFSNFADNLVPCDTDRATDVFIHDRLTGSTRRVSVSSGEAQANYASYGSDVSEDGRFVLFGSDATNLVRGDSNGQADLFVRDRQLGTTQQVRLTSDGAQPNGWSGGATMSADGSIIAFRSEATNLVPGDTNGLADVFVRDLRTGIVTRADVSSSGAQANGTGFLGGASLDDTGDLVA